MVYYLFAISKIKTLSDMLMFIKIPCSEIY